jgi:hypothetical protein
MSFGSSGVDQVRSLRKIPTQLGLANLCINGASSASFTFTFMQLRNGPKRAKNISFGSNGVDRVRSLRKDPMQLRLALLYVNYTSSASFSSTVVQ